MTLTNRTYHCLDGIFLKNGLSDSFILARRPQKFHSGHAPGCGRLCQFLNVPTERIYSANGPKYRAGGIRFFCLSMQNVTRQCVHLPGSAVLRCYPMECYSEYDLFYYDVFRLNTSRAWWSILSSIQVICFNNTIMVPGRQKSLRFP